MYRIISLKWNSNADYFHCMAALIEVT